MIEDWSDTVQRLATLTPKGKVSEMARGVGISPSYAHALLRGERDNPSEETRRSIARYIAERTEPATPSATLPPADMTLAEEDSRVKTARGLLDGVVREMYELTDPDAVRDLVEVVAPLVRACKRHQRRASSSSAAPAPAPAGGG